MRFRIFDGMEAMSEEQMETEISMLVGWRKEKALRYKFLIDRFLCAKAYLLLKQLLMEEYGIDCDPSFGYVANHKPVLLEYPEIQFNFSHCRKGILCVLDSRAVGCDIEEIPSRLDPELYRYCFNDMETERILSSEEPGVEFAKLWTMKEALLKMTGEGLRDDIKNLLQETDREDIGFQTVPATEKGYVYTICRRL